MTCPKFYIFLIWIFFLQVFKQRQCFLLNDFLTNSSILTIQTNSPKRKKILPFFLLMTVFFIPGASNLICAKILSLLCTIVNTVVQFIPIDCAITTIFSPFPWHFIIDNLSSSMMLSTFTMNFLRCHGGKK
uniref:Uncharacterized protein n=1 Tax=Octopus bimaculoides TaxID=37653 RepID=A0A0L8GH70_OCTBM